MGTKSKKRERERESERINAGKQYLKARKYGRDERMPPKDMHFQIDTIREELSSGDSKRSLQRQIVLKYHTTSRERKGEN